MAESHPTFLAEFGLQVALPHTTTWPPTAANVKNTGPTTWYVLESLGRPAQVCQIALLVLQQHWYEKPYFISFYFTEHPTRPQGFIR